MLVRSLFVCWLGGTGACHRTTTPDTTHQPPSPTVVAEDVRAPAPRIRIAARVQHVFRESDRPGLEAVVVAHANDFNGCLRDVQVVRSARSQGLPGGAVAVEWTIDEARRITRAAASRRVLIDARTAECVAAATRGWQLQPTFRGWDVQIAIWLLDRPGAPRTIDTFSLDDSIEMAYGTPLTFMTLEVESAPHHVDRGAAASAFRTALPALMRCERGTRASSGNQASVRWIIEVDRSGAVTFSDDELTSMLLDDDTYRIERCFATAFANWHGDERVPGGRYQLLFVLSGVDG